MRECGITTSPSPASIRTPPHANATAREAPVVLELGQRAVGARRGDLERPRLEQVAEVVRDALAEREINAGWVIDVQAKRLARRMLECDQLDLRIKLMDPVFDLPVKLVQLSFR
jgi:hypothetical protein